MTEIEQKLQAMSNKYNEFNPCEYLDVSLPETMQELKGTILYGLVNDVNAIFAKHNITQSKIDLVDIARVHHDEGIRACFDAIWIENDEIKTFPISVQSTY